MCRACFAGCSSVAVAQQLLCLLSAKNNSDVKCHASMVLTLLSEGPHRKQRIMEVLHDQWHRSENGQPVADLESRFGKHSKAVTTQSELGKRKYTKWAVITQVRSCAPSTIAQTNP